jgi:hypothetical protein
LALLFTPKWVLLSGIVGLGLTVAALTDSCLMGILLSKMPWNALRPTNKRFVSDVTDGQACALSK